MLIGSHVSMSGKAMLEGAVKESLSYGANTFMIYLEVVELLVFMLARR